MSQILFGKQRKSVDKMCNQIVELFYTSSAENPQVPHGFFMDFRFNRLFLLMKKAFSLQKSRKTSTKSKFGTEFAYNKMTYIIKCFYIYPFL